METPKWSKPKSSFELSSAFYHEVFVDIDSDAQQFVRKVRFLLQKYTKNNILNKYDNSCQEEPVEVYSLKSGVLGEDSQYQNIYVRFVASKNTIYFDLSLKRFDYTDISASLRGGLKIDLKKTGNASDIISIDLQKKSYSIHYSVDRAGSTIAGCAHRKGILDDELLDEISGILSTYKK